MGDGRCGACEASDGVDIRQSAHERGECEGGVVGVPGEERARAGAIETLT